VQSKKSILGQTLAIGLLLGLGESLLAQIAISGLTEQTVYTDSVTFTLTPEAGYSASATLDGQPLPFDEPVTVAAADYYELTLVTTNQLSNEVSTRVIQFIVRASERSDSEWGLPPWTPYPLIPSSAAELADAQLELILPAAFPATLDLPVIARLQDSQGNAVRGNGTLTGFAQPPVVLRRGVGSGFVSSPHQLGSLEYLAELPGVASTGTVVIEPEPAWTPVSGALSGAVEWPEDSRIALTGTLTIPRGGTLTVGGGSVIQLDPGVDVVIDGQLLVEGSVERPVVFTPRQRTQPWGGFILQAATARLTATGAIFVGSGANSRWFDDNPGYDVHRREQALFLIDGAEVNLTNCFAIDHQGQFGHGQNGRLTLDHCLVQRFITGGEYNDGTVRILQSALMEFPEDSGTFADDDNDAIYFTRGQHEVRDSLIGWAKDDGIDHGSGGPGTIVVSNCWVEACFHDAYAWSGEGRIADMHHAVSLNSGQGIEAGWSTGNNSPRVTAQHCLSIGNLSGARFGDNYDWTYNGLLTITDSFLLFNYRDVFGFNWNDWTYRESQMDLQGNWLTEANSHYANNNTWDPMTDGWRLADFLTTRPDAPVGVGLALWEEQLSLDHLTQGVPVGLSSFTTNIVTVRYQVETPNVILHAGSLSFEPGETVKQASVELPPGQAAELLRFRLTDVEGGQITGRAEAWMVADTPVTLIPASSGWFYLDDGSDPGDTWTAPDFDHSNWNYGLAELGYGDASAGRPETTVISYGSDPDAKFITYFFRHAFRVDQPNDYDRLNVYLKRDDGAVVHLNGQPIFTSNITTAPVDVLTRADSAEDDGVDFHLTSVSASFLRPGANTLAVEIHQTSPTSSDVSFDLRLEAEPPPSLRVVSMDGERFLLWTATDFALESTGELDGTWKTSPAPSPAPLPTGLRQQFYRLKQLPEPVLR